MKRKKRLEKEQEKQMEDEMKQERLNRLKETVKVEVERLVQAKLCILI